MPKLLGHSEEDTKQAAGTQGLGKKAVGMDLCLQQTECSGGWSHEID